MYGWKKQGRQAAIAEADIVVGNTAVEVGVDFDRVNRLIFTAHEPNSALQRLGRMRARDRFEDYRALCISTDSVQDAVARQSRDGALTRTALEDIFMTTLSQPGTSLPYDDLCAAYTRYLWSDATPSLNEMYVPAESKTPFQQLVHTHFGPELEQLYDRSLTVTDLWQHLTDSPFLQQQHIMQELHTYRSSSLGCLVIDTTDADEPLKQYNLQHVLRYRRGRLVDLDALPAEFRAAVGRELTPDEQEYVQQAQQYTECGFIATGRRSQPRELGAYNLGWDPVQPSINTLEALRPTVSPAIEGQEHLDPLSTDVLACYVPASPQTARQRYDLGPYANLLPYHDGTLFLWDDALLAYTAYLAHEAN